MASGEGRLNGIAGRASGAGSGSIVGDSSSIGSSSSSVGRFEGSGSGLGEIRPGALCKPAVPGAAAPGAVPLPLPPKLPPPGAPPNDASTGTGRLAVAAADKFRGCGDGWLCGCDSGCGCDRSWA